MTERPRQSTATYVVDGVGESMVRLVADTGSQVSVAGKLLPGGIAEGSVLRVPHKPDGTPDWQKAQIDTAETERRLDQANSILKELRKRDPGGDIEL